LLTWSSFWLLSTVVSGQLSKVSSGIAVAADVADVNVIAEPVSKERCLPVDEWITNVTPVANVIKLFGQ